MKLEQSSSTLLVADDGGMSISTYNDQLTNPTVAKYIKKVKDAFPDLPAGFYSVFSERIVNEQFTDRRLIDAVNHVVDTCIYPRPTVAQFISWDRRFQMFTWDQMLKKFEDSGMGSKFWGNYKSFNFKDKATRVWIHINDVKQYNITE